MTDAGAAARDAGRDTSRVAFRHLAIVVPDPRAAEEYYCRVFAMEVVGREAEAADGEWYSLPPDKGWADAEAAGIELGFVALRRDHVVLPLFRGPAIPGQIHAVGLVMDAQSIGELRARLPASATVEAAEPAYLEFVDPFGIRWQISTNRRFRTSGDISGRWLEV